MKTSEADGQAQAVRGQEVAMSLSDFFSPGALAGLFLGWNLVGLILDLLERRRERKARRDETAGHSGGKD